MSSLCIALLILSVTSLSTAEQSEDEGSVRHYDVIINKTEYHDENAFIQGLVFHNNSLYESTGRYNESSLRKLSTTGEILDRQNLSGDEFGEGLALYNDTLIQLTWKKGLAHVWDLESLTYITNYSFEGEGWGLCASGSTLFMSNGSSELSLRHASNFTLFDSLSVTYEGEPLEQLNELECVGDFIYANVWYSQSIFIIDVHSGEVIGVINASGLMPDGTGSGDVLNGIAYDDENGTFWVTGKRWPVIYEVNWRVNNSYIDDTPTDSNSTNGGAGGDLPTSGTVEVGLLTEFVIIGLSILMALATIFLWGKGFGSLTNSRWVHNPSPTTILHEEEE